MVSDIEDTINTGHYSNPGRSKNGRFYFFFKVSKFVLKIVSSRGIIYIFKHLKMYMILLEF